MSGEVLREAAALMRERAWAVTPGPWRPEADGFSNRVYAGGKGVWNSPVVTVSGYDEGGGCESIADAEYIASWNPSVALAVADWLGQVARLYDRGSTGPLDMPAALEVAHAYLGTKAAGEEGPL